MLDEVKQFDEDSAKVVEGLEMIIALRHEKRFDKEWQELLLRFKAMVERMRGRLANKAELNRKLQDSRKPSGRTAAAKNES
jgi:hypothetical protein